MELLSPLLPRPVVAFLGVHPAAFAAIGKMLLLPEGRRGFQVVHDEGRAVEGSMAMGRDSDYEHDIGARRDLADAVDGGCLLYTARCV